MTPKILGLGTAVAVLAFAFSAHALTVTNRDTTDQSLTIMEGTESSTVSIKPGETMSNLCANGCKVMLGAEEQQFDGQEVVTIEGGKLIIAE